MTDSPSRATVGCFECGIDRTGKTDRACSLFYPPMTCSGGEHQHDAAAYRSRPGSIPEHLHDLDPHLQIALIVADHGFTTEQQRARMINVDVARQSVGTSRWWTMRWPQPRRILSIQPSAANQGAGFWE